MSIVVESLQAGNASGPTLMVKDTIDIAGLATRAGSQALTSVEAATEHAEVVEQMISNGWQVVAKTNLHELAYGTTGINHWTGTALNPRYPERIPGGSSSGSAAAVAAGLCEVALGTDTGGSIRTPAACCGVIGLKPTFGRVSRRGVMPAVSSLDCVGPLARSMAAIVAAMQAMCADFGVLPEAADVLARLTIGAVTTDGSAEVETTLAAALKALDLPLQAVELNGMSAAYDAGMTIINRETWNACGHLLDSGRVGDDVAARLRAAANTSAADLAAAEQVRTEFTAEVDALLALTPVLALPTLPDIPVLLEQAADTRALLGMTRFVRPFNLSGHPAISLPLVSTAGLPVGLQLVAARGADEWLCAVACEISRRLDGTTFNPAGLISDRLEH